MQDEAQVALDTQELVKAEREAMPEETKIRKPVGLVEGMERYVSKMRHLQAFLIQHISKAYTRGYQDATFAFAELERLRGEAIRKAQEQEAARRAELALSKAQQSPLSEEEKAKVAELLQGSAE